MGERGSEHSTRSGQAAPGGDALYALGIFGAAVYYWQRADSNGQRATAVLKGLVWPAFMVYEAFSVLNGRPECEPPAVTGE